MTRLELAKQVLQERMVGIDESQISYETPRGAFKSEILSDIFYDVFDCKPTKKELEWLDEEDKEYQTWLITEFF